MNFWNKETEKKFFVINVERFEELNHNTRAKGCNCRSVGECYCDMFGLELADEVEEFKIENGEDSKQITTRNPNQIELLNKDTL